LILVTIVVTGSKQQIQKEEEEDRHELETIVLVCLLGPVLTGVSGAVTSWALNARGQNLVTRIDVAQSPTYVYIHHSDLSDLPELQIGLPDGLWIRLFTNLGSARRLLASDIRPGGPNFDGGIGITKTHKLEIQHYGVDSGTGPCPEDHLRLPVEPVVQSGVTSYRVPNSMANVEPEDCSFWWGTLAKKFNLGPLAPPKCLENQLTPDQKAAQIAAQTATSKLPSSLRMRTSDNKYIPGVGAVPFSQDDPGRVRAAQKVQNFPTWQLWGVVVIAVVLLLVTCFASSQQKEVDVYSLLKQNVDEF